MAEVMLADQLGHVTGGELPLSDQRLRSRARRTIECERDALDALLVAFDRTDLQSALIEATHLIATRRGRVAATGIGKSGIIARKISATLASTGTPSFFVHPAEASHGDLGMVTRNDVVLAFSRSGETAELSDIVSFCHRCDVPLIAVTGSASSSLARQSRIALVLPVVPEACPNHVAPTSSTAIQLAIGDAVAMALLELRGFSAADFHLFHPRGTLGTQLLRLNQLMATGGDVPRIGATGTILDAMIEMTRKRFGITGIIDAAGKLIGAFTDGDLRRATAIAALTDPVIDHASKDPYRAPATLLATDALTTMNSRSISQVFICSPDGQLVGIVHLHDIIRAGII